VLHFVNAATHSFPETEHFHRGLHPHGASSRSCSSQTSPDSHPGGAAPPIHFAYVTVFVEGRTRKPAKGLKIPAKCLVVFPPDSSPSNTMRATFASKPNLCQFRPLRSLSTWFRNPAEIDFFPRWVRLRSSRACVQYNPSSRRGHEMCS
jgi:hypothetical protein